MRYLPGQFFLFFILSVLLQFSVLPAAAEVGVAEFDSKAQHIDLTPYIEILPDPGQSLTLSDVINEKRADFRLVSEISNSFGFTNAAYWVHFSLHMDQSLRDAPLLQLEFPLFDNVILFIPDGSGGYSRKVTGDSLRFAEREVRHRTFLFRLPEQRGETRDYYMRLQTAGSAQIALSLWKAESFIEEVDGTNFLLGIYYGVMLLLCFAACVSYWKIRDRLFLYYGIYLLSYILIQFSLNGFSYQYLWSELPWFTSRATTALLGTVVVTGLLFGGSFLQIWGGKHPRIKLLFSLLMIWGGVGTLLSLFGDFAFAVKFSTLAALFVPPVLLITIVRSLASGYRPARYFFVAWCVFLSGVFVEILLYFGFVPRSFLSVHSMQIGSTFEVILLGYALMDKIDLLRIDKENAIIQANVYLKQLNEELETLVDERTRKLRKQNTKLKEIAVQDSMTGLLNHKASLEFLRLKESFAQRYEKSLAVIMLDIDYFKSINDRFGHPAGDKVIIAVADVLLATLRESDGCGRYGGEEFLLILPESDIDSASVLAERIRKTIEELKIPEIDDIQVTASFGVAVFDISQPYENLISLADKALYKAKQSGRNRVALSVESGG